MFRKITIAAVSMTAFALMLCGNDNSASQAFARGGRGGQGVHRGYGSRGFHDHRGHYNRNYGRSYGWGYPSYYSYDYPSVDYAPIYSGTDSYASYGGYGRYRNYDRHNGGFHSRGGRGRR